MTAYPNTLPQLTALHNRLTDPMRNADGDSRPDGGSGAGRPWLLKHRLTSADVDEIVVGFRSGATGRDLAARFNVGLTSIRRLLREAAARR